MSEERWDELAERMREDFNPPPETPRDEMWAAIEGRLGARDDVVSLETVRRSRSRGGWRRPAGWAAAAAVLVIMGIGIGRMSAPVPAGAPDVAVEDDDTALRMATREHLGRTESLLTLVRADGRSGRLDPMVAEWAQGLLQRTRLLLDTDGVGDPAMRDLLEDLELVLVQIVGVAEVDEGSPRARTELDLALRGLEHREVLPRIQAVAAAGPVMAGT